MEELDLERALRQQQSEKNIELSLENKSLSLLFTEATNLLHQKHRKKIIVIGLENSGKSAVANHICGAELF